MHLAKALAAGLLLFAACTQTATRSPRTPDPGASGPLLRSGGTVDVGVLGDVPTLDPYSPRATDLTRTLVRPVYPSLYRLRPDGAPIPDLASSIRSEGRGVIVSLADRRWSDGRKIDARDVVLSVRRARPPSGLSGLRAKVLGGDQVRLTGRVQQWEQRLARAGFVLPRGRARKGVSGGPLRIVRRVPGLKVVYERSPDRPDVNIERLRVFSFQDQGSMRSMVGEKDIDVALFPSTVNLEDRLPEGVRLHRAVGWESIWLDLRHAGLSDAERKGFAAALDRSLLEESFIRSGGRVTDTISPGPGRGGTDGSFERPTSGSPPGNLSLASPEGDELLSSLRRAVQLQLAPATRSDLVTLDVAIFYSRPSASGSIRLLRSLGAPGYAPLQSAQRDLSVIPLFHVASYALTNGIEGIKVNPTIEGLLWNVEEWGFPAGD